MSMSNNTRHILKHGIAFMTLFVLLALPLFVLAQTAGTPITADDLLNSGTGTSIGEVAGLGQQDIRTTIASIINVAMGLLGTVAIVIILIGGFQWMTAAGNEEKVEGAKKVLTAGIIGLAIVLAAYSITQFVVKSLVTATTGTTTSAAQ